MGRLEEGGRNALLFWCAALNHLQIFERHPSQQVGKEIVWELSGESFFFSWKRKLNIAASSWIVSCSALSSNGALYICGFCCASSTLSFPRCFHNLLDPRTSLAAPGCLLSPVQRPGLWKILPAPGRVQLRHEPHHLLLSGQGDECDLQADSLLPAQRERKQPHRRLRPISVLTQPHHLGWGPQQWPLSGVKPQQGVWLVESSRLSCRVEWLHSPGKVTHSQGFLKH